LEERGTLVFLAAIERHGHVAVSERQLFEVLGGRDVDFFLTEEEAASEEFLSNFDAVLGAKLPMSFRRKYLRRAWKFSSPRPCIGACFPGIDFTPEVGIENRRFLDVICLNSEADFAAYQRLVPESERAKQKAIRLNPSLIRSEPDRRLLKGSVNKVYFFAQAIVPETLGGRVDVLRLLNESARRHPDKTFVLKLRHLRGENNSHVHRERFSYEWIAERVLGEELSPNMTFSSASMEKCLEDADYCLTCSSTAALEAVARGIPTGFLLDYEGGEKGKWNKPARIFLSNSNLILSRQEVLDLVPRTPKAAWVDSVLSAPGDFDRLLSIIREFHDKQGNSVAPMIYPGYWEAKAHSAKTVARRFKRKLLVA
jgi:hypothetical protein